MKILAQIFLTALIFLYFAAAQISAQQTSPAVQEAAKLNGEAVKLFQEKKFSEALPLMQKVVAIRQTELGRNHLSLAQAYWNLAYIQLALDKRKEAAVSFENAFDVYEKNQPLSAADEKSFAKVLEIVAINQAYNGEIDKAEKKLQRNVELNEKIYGSETLETSDSLLKLADLYQVKGDLEKAAPLLLRALDIKSKKGKPDSDDTDDVFQRAECVLTKLGRSKELRELEDKFYPSKQNSAATADPPSVDTGVINGKAINLVAPAYPAEARTKRVSGQVNIKVVINESGDVIHACAIKGAKELQRASELAAYASKFTPTIFQGKPVKVTGIIVYNFVAH